MLAAPGVCAAASPIQIGQLTCQVDGGQGRILGSSRELSCIFERPGMPIERYAGEINRIGIDIGSTQYSDIAWTVFSLTGTPGLAGVLEGNYAGLSGELTVGRGLGANVLVGGLERSVALQPISLQSSQGFNLALGVAQMQLISVGSFGEPDAQE
ncbi:MAG: DUF992 domain-containing protein [Nitratireductor sp.]|nr:DUF992 domain-containing protein [Nitratireductor sp.]MCB1455787.1 DUF992 domain-containing protein [Nitratireductor sp.]MCB1460568.1 DUF992 domain-containing protein [Nitratireductor sp.]